MKSFHRTLLISLLLSILIAPAVPVELAAAQSGEPTIYVVQAGDTLYSIAQRYGIDVNALAETNGLINPDQIYVGQSLTIPSPSAASTSTGPSVNRIHAVQKGETLFSIAVTLGTSIRAIAEANHFSNTNWVLIGQQLVIPISTKSPTLAQPSTPLPAPFISIDIGPLPLQQGSLLVITVRTVKPVTLSGTFYSQTIPFAIDNEKYIGLAGAGASPVTGVKPGIYPVSVSAVDNNGTQTTVTTNVQINAGHFNFEYINLPPDRQDLLDPTLLAYERDKLNAVWTIFNPTRYWHGLFNVPVDHYTRISSPFGTRRSYDGGPFTSYHEGTDFAIPAGTPVYAPADGVVVLAELLTVRGNAIVIDHGWGVFSGLYHLQSFNVTVGQVVHQGDLVALSDNTGLSTGAHLHWDIRIRGLNVNALFFTQQVYP
ncbi:MAG TPA: LysM peptidoglycan-binding domain-containing protein [Anaerolineae bacterium]|nr:LysM peptidoglycan-binding domain-containing protein [Anaerolineae bacterium]